MIPKYQKVRQMGMREVADIFDGPVEITEKLDGSQFAFGIVGGELQYRSKGRQIPRHSVAESDLFYNTVTYVEAIAEAGLVPEEFWFYGEAFKSPKHSTLRYNRIPRNHFALWAATGVAQQDWFPYGGLQTFADAMEVELVQHIPLNNNASPQAILNFLASKPESQLGGQVEGVVIKNYAKEHYERDDHHYVMCAKYVSEAFKEVHEKSWNRENTGKGKWTVFQEQFRTEQRWHKAIQHLAENGNLTGSPKDIGNLLQEVQRDIGMECKEEIKTFLWREFGKDLLRNSTRGLPEWYKEQIALGQVIGLENTNEEDAA